MTKKLSGRAYLESEVDTENIPTGLEKFYVYKSLHSDESWGAQIINAESVLPNCDFLMKVYAFNETEAIERARQLYDKVHKDDSHKDNLRRFAAAALKSTAKAACDKAVVLNEVNDKDIDLATDLAMDLAISLNEKYDKYFESFDKE